MCVSMPPSIDAFARGLVDIPSFIVTVIKFFKQEVEKNSLNYAKLKKRFVTLAESIEEKELKVEDGVPMRKIGLDRSPSPFTDISDKKKASLKEYCNERSSFLSDIRRYNVHRQKRRISHHFSHRYSHSLTPRHVS